jgi:2-hydroxychromene-2-carboxylate isomerase
MTRFLNASGSAPLDIEDIDEIAAILVRAGAAEEDFRAAEEALRAEVAAISRVAEAEGVFGVPTFLVEGGLYWGARIYLPFVKFAT